MHFSSFNKKLLIFPTSRSIREYLKNLNTSNTLLPTFLTIDEFLKKVLLFDERFFIDDEERFLFLKEAANISELKNLGFSNEFSFFFKQSSYLFQFFGEMASEQVDINSISDFDTYEFYQEHIGILKKILVSYKKLLDENRAVDKINFNEHYSINKDFLNKFDEIGFFYEGYLTRTEFEILKKVSKSKPTFVNLFSTQYNQKSLESLKKLGINFKINYDYIIDLQNEKIIQEHPTQRYLEQINIEAFSSRTNQIAFIKKSITKFVQEGIDVSKIALVLPDESFAAQLQLFDSEGYFNYAMGLNIHNENLYRCTHAIMEYLNEDEQKSSDELTFLGMDKNFIDSELKSIWNERLSQEAYDKFISFISSYETKSEIIEKFEEIIFRLKNLFFKVKQDITIKEAVKITFQKLSKITLDDVNSGPITVMGLLESRAVHYDALIIVDFNEGFIPKRSVKDKFLSTSIKQAVQLPTSLDRENLQKYYYFRIINRAKKVAISYVKSDAMQISRFANELFKNQKIESAVQDERYKKILFNRYLLNHFNQEVEIEIDLSKLSWSATSLKTYLSCKRKYYLQYISSIKEHNCSLKPQGFELGDLIHKTLFDAYSQNMSESVKYSKLIETLHKQKSDNPYLLLDLEVWKKRLESFVQLEDSRFNEALKVISLEQPFTCIYKGIKLKGVIDRIDNLGADTLLVLDYKTSSNLKIDTIKNYEKSKDFQLEFYFLAAKELYKQVDIKTFYYDLYDCSLKEEIALEPKLELLDTFLSELHTKTVKFDKTNEKSNCQYCAYTTICDR